MRMVLSAYNCIRLGSYAESQFGILQRPTLGKLMRQLSQVFFFAVSLAGVSSAAADELFVTLQSPASVVAVDESTGAVRNVITSGLTYPRGIVYNPTNGNIYVADAPTAAGNFNNGDQFTIKEFTTSGAFITSFNAGGTGLYQGGLAVDSSGDIYVTGAIENQFGQLLGGEIREYTSAGTFIAAAQSVGPASIFVPFQLAVDSANNVYATDAGNATILKYGPGLSSVSLFASTGTSPLGIAVGGDGNIYVGAGGSRTYDAAANLIFQTNSISGYANVLGSDGYLYALNPPGIFRLNVPSGNPASFFQVNQSSLPGAEWMTQVPVPEPSTFILAALGLAGLGLSTLRKKLRPV
jgi:hypothetical protein